MMKLKVVYRIWFGVAVPLAALVVVAGIGTMGLDTAFSHFSQYRDAAKDNAAAGTLETSTLVTRIGVKDFLIKPGDAARRRVEELIAAQRTDLATAVREVDTPAMAGMLADAKAGLDAYETAFSRVAGLSARSEERLTVLNGLGPRIEQGLTDLMKSASDGGNLAAAYQAGLSLRAILLVRVAVLRHMRFNDQASIDQARGAMAETDRQMAGLGALLREVGRIRAYEEIRSLVQQYEAAMADKFAADIEMLKVVEEQLNPSGQRIAKAASSISDAATALQDELGPKARAAIEQARTLDLGISGGMFLVACILALLVARSVSRPLVAITGVMSRLAEGNKSVEIPHTANADEIGDMARAVEVFKRNAIEAERLAAEQEKEQVAKQRRAEAIDGLVKGFEGSVVRILSSVGGAAKQLDSTAQGMAAIAEETSRQASATAAAAEQTSANVQTVASASEEMAATLQEISTQVAKSSEVASKAAREADETNETVRGLAEAAQKIGDVVSLINNIAAQTNLLALNATIEAARAGEAGKGFAVVASEVKSLANQTAKATDEISAQIAAMQSVTNGAVQAIQGIGQTIVTVNQVTASIASAVEEQTAATGEIARNVQQAAQGTAEVSSNIVQVTEASVQTGTSATQVLQAAAQLGEQSDTLRQEVERFLSGIRAA